MPALPTGPSQADPRRAPLGLGQDALKAAARGLDAGLDMWPVSQAAGRTLMVGRMLWLSVCATTTLSTSAPGDREGPARKDPPGSLAGRDCHSSLFSLAFLRSFSLPRGPGELPAPLLLMRLYHIKKESLGHIQE